MEYGFIAGKCPYNEFLQCGEQEKCDRCGWNEAVAAERTKKYWKKWASRQRMNKRRLHHGHGLPCPGWSL